MFDMILCVYTVRKKEKGISQVDQLGISQARSVFRLGYNKSKFRFVHCACVHGYMQCTEIKTHECSSVLERVLDRTGSVWIVVDEEFFFFFSLFF